MKMSLFTIIFSLVLIYLIFINFSNYFSQESFSMPWDSKKNKKRMQKVKDESKQGKKTVKDKEKEISDKVLKAINKTKSIGTKLENKFTGWLN